MPLIFRLLRGWAMLKRRMWPVYSTGLAVTVLAGLAAQAGAAVQAGAAAAQGAQAGPGMAPVGAAPALPARARLDGTEPKSDTLHVTIALRSAHPARLDRLATKVATPGTTQFRHFLRPAQVQRRFGPPAAVLARTRAWLHAQHLATQPVLGDGLLLPVTGSVRQFEAAFRVKIARVRLAGEPAGLGQPVVPGTAQSAAPLGGRGRRAGQPARAAPTAGPRRAAQPGAAPGRPAGAGRGRRIGARPAGLPGGAHHPARVHRRLAGHRVQVQPAVPRR